MKAFARPWARLAISFLLNRSPGGESVWVRFKVEMRFPIRGDSINLEYFNYFQMFRHLFCIVLLYIGNIFRNKLNSEWSGAPILKDIAYKALHMLLCRQIFLQVYILHFKKQYKIIQGNCSYNDVDRDKIKSKKYLTIDRWLISGGKKREKWYHQNIS